MTDNNKKITLRMSLIPLIAIGLLILGAGYFLLQDEIKLPSFNKGPQIRRLEGFPTEIVTTSSLEKQRRVVTNEQELAEFLNYIDPTGITELKTPVNFDKEVLVAVASPTYDELGHTIKVKKVYEDKNDKLLTIVVEETELGDKCKIELESNVVADVVAVTKTDYKVHFERQKKTIDCEGESTSSDTGQNVSDQGQ